MNHRNGNFPLILLKKNSLSCQELATSLKIVPENFSEKIFVNKIKTISPSCHAWLWNNSKGWQSGVLDIFYLTIYVQLSFFAKMSCNSVSWSEIGQSRVYIETRNLVKEKIVHLLPDSNKAAMNNKATHWPLIQLGNTLDRNVANLVSNKSIGGNHMKNSI